MKRKQIVSIASIMFVILSMILIVVRCFYGINFDDEMAYLSVVRRMAEGQWVILHDWNTPTLLSSWLTYLLVGWTGAIEAEACILIFRILYILFQWLVCTAMFFSFKKKSWSFFAILIYLYATPYNINTLSYNTLSIGFMMLICAYITTRETWRLKEYLIVGVLCSFCILSNPYVMLLYIAYFVACIIGTIRKQKAITLLTLPAFGKVTGGAFVIFVVFVVSMMSKGNIGTYLDNMKLLLQDTEHAESSNLLVKFMMAIYQIIRVYWRVTIPMGIIILLTLLKKSNEKINKILIWLSLFFVAYGIIRFSFIYGSVYPNLMLIPFNLLGIEAYLLTKKRNKTLFFGWYVVGILYGMCIYVGTNTGILSGSAAFVVPSVATFLLILDYVKEQEKALHIGACALLILEVACILWLRLTYVWADGSLAELQYKIEEGPAKYLYTTKEGYDRYYSMMEEVENAGIEKEDCVLFLPMQPLYYLSNPGICASPYTKRFLVNQEELMNYYSIHEELVPNKIIYTDQAVEEEVQEIQRVLEWFKGKGYHEGTNQLFR